MPEVTGKRILGIYDSEDGPVYLTNYGTGRLAINKAPKKMVKEWRKAEKGETIGGSYTYRIEDDETMNQSLLADDREDYVFGALVKGVTKLAKSAGESLLSKAQQTAIKNSKGYKQTVKELTTDNAQGAGVVYTKAEIKALEKDSPADANFEMFNEFLMSKETHDRQANELIDAGVKPASVKRILSSDIEDEDLTEGERSIRNKFMNKYFSKEEELDIGLGPVKREPILIEHEAGKEPKAIGGLMNQSLLDSQDFNKDTGFPSVGPAAPALAPRESSITAERGSPTTDFPGDQMKKSLLADERQPYVVGALVKMGTKAGKIILQQATDEVQNIKKALSKSSTVENAAENIQAARKADKKAADDVETWDGYHYGVRVKDSIDELEENLFEDPVLSNTIKKLKKDIYSKYTDEEIADTIYEDALSTLENKILRDIEDVDEVKSSFKAEKELSDAEEAADIAAYRKQIYGPDADPRFAEFGLTTEDLKPMTSEQKRKSAEALKRAKEQGIPPFNVGGRVSKQEGSLMVPPEMEALESDMPADTYPNIPPEEMDEAMESQLPDAEMEDKHMEFVFEESLDDEEQSYLMNALEADPKLSQIFDKVLTTASEFTGAGEVEGPGTGVSDSIPARLSDGEFVFTDKATEEIGSDNLQAMMDDAERAYDGGAIRKPAQEGGLLLYKGRDEDPLAYEKIAQDEIKKNMLRSNRAPSLNPG